MMYRIPVFMLVSALLCALEAQTLLDPSVQLQNYNHKLALKLKHKQKLQSLAKISTDEAVKMAEALCREKVLSSSIRHQGRLLYYMLHTPNCTVKINALDGQKISLIKQMKETDK